MFTPKYKIKKLFRTDEERRRYYLQTMIERKEASKAFVQEGFVYCKETCISGITRPIPAGESAITALAVSSTGLVWGATSGKKSHFFYYNVKPSCGQIVDAGTLPNETSATSIAVTADNTVLIGTSKGSLFELKAKRRIINEGVQEWMAQFVPAKKLRTPFSKDPIAALCVSEGLGRIFGLTGRTGTVFEYLPEESRIKILFKIGSKGFAPVMACDYYGHIYLIVKGFSVIRYNCLNDRTDILAGPDKSLKNVRSIAISTDVSKIVRSIFFGDSEGRLFEYKANSRITTLLGKPCREKNIKLLAASKNSMLYGIAGGKDDLAHLFKFDPALKVFKDLGVMLASLEKSWYGYVFGSIASGPEGELYIGEADRESNIFIYHPPSR